MDDLIIVGSKSNTVADIMSKAYTISKRKKRNTYSIVRVKQDNLKDKSFIVVKVNSSSIILTLDRESITAMSLNEALLNDIADAISKP